MVPEPHIGVRQESLTYAPTKTALQILDSKTMKTKLPFVAVLLLIGLLGYTAQAGTVNIALVPVGNPGNVADTLTGNGAVPYVYYMGEYDVTTGQYAAFLNSVATTGDPYGLYTAGMATDLPTVGITRTSNSGTFSYAVKGNGNVPVFDVSWYDAARFVNWLGNGEPIASEGTGTTETGTYTLSAGQISRNSGSNWVLPTVNEWYKSAYYSGGGLSSLYWVYPTQSDTPPSNALSATGTNNANYTATISQPPFSSLTDPVNYLTPVGAFADSPSAYGTYDQSGDVVQWNETAYGGTARGVGGGGYGGNFVTLSSGGISEMNPSDTSGEQGFRVAYVPEPATISLLVAGASLFFLKRLLLINRDRKA